jgi:uncharacterized protein (TIGR03067 family)
MRTLAVLLFACMTTSAAPVPKEVVKRPDSELFVGAWDMVVSEAGGQPHSKARWTFDAALKMVSTPAGGAGGGSEWIIKIDPAKTPKEIDIGGYKGIYEFVGADIRLVYTLGGPRPTDYEPVAGKYYNLLRRAEKK